MLPTFFSKVLHFHRKPFPLFFFHSAPFSQEMLLTPFFFQCSIFTGNASHLLPTALHFHSKLPTPFFSLTSLHFHRKCFPPCNLKPPSKDQVSLSHICMKNDLTHANNFITHHTHTHTPHTTHTHFKSNQQTMVTIIVAHAS